MINPKLPLDAGRIYTLTVGSVLTSLAEPDSGSARLRPTHQCITNLCQLLFRATLKVSLDSCLSLLLEWTTSVDYLECEHYMNQSWDASQLR